MNKRVVLNKLKFKKLKTWQLLLVLIPLGFLDATVMRFDHLKMVELRDEVLAADEAEDDERLASALDNLKNYTFGNIVINVTDDNGIQKVAFGTGPFYLEHQYRRAAEKALEEAENTFTSDENPNGNVYAMASNTCKPLAIANGWTWSSPEFINCMTSEIEKYPAADDIKDQMTAALPSTELYRKNYASPIWAPTLSGFLLLITAIIIVVIFIRFIIWIILRLSLLFL